MPGPHPPPAGRGAAPRGAPGGRGAAPGGPGPPRRSGATGAGGRRAGPLTGADPQGASRRLRPRGGGSRLRSVPPGRHTARDVRRDDLVEVFRAQGRQVVPLWAFRPPGVGRRPRDPGEAAVLRAVALRVGRQAFATWIGADRSPELPSRPGPVIPAAAIARVRADLPELRKIRHPLEVQLPRAAVTTPLLAGAGGSAIVGGSAVLFYTGGAYLSRDVGLVTEVAGPGIWPVLAVLGFERPHGAWVHAPGCGAWLSSPFACGRARPGQPAGHVRGAGRAQRAGGPADRPAPRRGALVGHRGSRMVRGHPGAPRRGEIVGGVPRDPGRGSRSGGVTPCRRDGLGPQGARPSRRGRPLSGRTG